MMDHAGVSVAAQGIDGVTWNILGQIYVPLQHSASCMAWQAHFPPEAFVPPHVHASQDEFVLIQEGKLTAVLSGTDHPAGPGDLIRLPRGEPHGLFNRSGAPVTCFFWVTPTARLWDLFVAIDGLTDKAEIMRLAGLHEVSFLPPD